MVRGGFNLKGGVRVFLLAILGYIRVLGLLVFVKTARDCQCD